HLGAALPRRRTWWTLQGRAGPEGGGRPGALAENRRPRNRRPAYSSAPGPAAEREPVAPAPQTASAHGETRGAPPVERARRGESRGGGRSSPRRKSSARRW